MTTIDDLFAVISTIKGNPKVYIEERPRRLIFYFHRQHNKHFSKVFFKRKWMYYNMPCGVEIIFKQINHFELRRLAGNSQRYMFLKPDAFRSKNEA